jgi:hypothetical protein
MQSLSALAAGRRVRIDLRLRAFLAAQIGLLSGNLLFMLAT